MVGSLLASLLAGALQCPPMQHVVVRASTIRMATTPEDVSAYPLSSSDCLSGSDDVRASRIDSIEECLVELEEARDDPAMYGELLDELTRVKREGMTAGSSEWVAVVVEAEQRSERLSWAAKQQASQQGQAFIRERENAERKAGEGLAYGSNEWAVAVDRAATETAAAYRVATMQKAAAREAANRKRAALLGALFADSGSGGSGGGGGGGSQLASSVAVDTDAALDVLFNSGYDVEGKAGQLSKADMERMKGLIASTSAALRLDREDVTLLLRRAALCVALGEPALARQDYERVLALEPTNPEAAKYVDLANYGANFDPYTILGVPRSADTAMVSLAFRRLAKQWHPDRWMP
jgi:hypothetical protein